MPELEGPDAYIPMARAAQISDLDAGTVRQQALNHRLRYVRIDGRLYTTRRWLHAYLTSRPAMSGRKPLPAGYVAPE
jgi:hypothetical protein